MEKYIKSDFEIGDKVILNSTYFREGLAYFGDELKYPRNKKHFFTIKNIFRGDGRKDGHHDIIEDTIEVDGGSYKGITTICSRLIEKV